MGNEELQEGVVYDDIQGINRYTGEMLLFPHDVEKPSGFIDDNDLKLSWKWNKKDDRMPIMRVSGDRCEYAFIGIRVVLDPITPGGWEYLCSKLPRKS